MDKQQKKRIKRTLLLGAAALAVAVFAVLPVIAAARKTSDDPQASILTAAARIERIDTQLVGGGQLSSDASVSVKIPENVKLTAYMVNNGDAVSRGDVVATVDRVSVMTAITQVQETLDYLSEEIADISAEEASDTVKALAGGTVKAIYAQAGESVQSVMLEHGALAVLSLDGLMAVRITCETELNAGDTVLVAFPDGTQADGRIRSKLEGVLTITVEDDGYALGEAVTVSGADGTALGGGELYVYSPWNATGYSGTVSRVLAAEGDTVRAGQTLLRLEDAGHVAEYQMLIDQRQEYESLMQELFQMVQSGTVVAPCDGIVTGVDTEGAYLLGNDGGELDASQLPLTEGTASAANLADTAGGTALSGAGVTRLSVSAQGTAASGGLIVNLASLSQRSAGAVSAVAYQRPVTLADPAAPGSGGAVQILPDQLISGTVGQTYTAALSASDGSNTLTGTWAATGLPGGLSINDSTGVISGTPTASGSYPVTVSFTESSGTPVIKSYTLAVADAQPGAVTCFGYVAQVISVAGNTMSVRQSAYSYPITDLTNLPTVPVDTSALTVDAAYTSPLISAVTAPVDSYMLLVVDPDGTTLRELSQLSVSPGDPGSGSESGMPGGSFSGGGLGSSMPSGGSTGGAGGMGQAETFELYSLSKLTIASVTSQENMTVSIAVDELDITKIYVGQPAVISVDALGGEQFAASVSEIANSGENDGGNSKFTVVLTLEKSGDMLPGMVSSAFITLDAAENAVCIPVAALNQQESASVVYTGYDEKEGCLTDPVIVVTGASDGENVEIVSGLTEGQICYYAYYDTFVETTTTQSRSGFSLARLLRG